VKGRPDSYRTPIKEIQIMLGFIWRKNRRTSTAPTTRPRFRPRLEALEDRCLLSGGVLQDVGALNASPFYTITLTNATVAS
jgi:hypothetical protein